MKASDTVMSDEQLDNIGYPILPIGDRTGSRRVAQAQAEISFKAGMKEVVEWVEAKSSSHSNGKLYVFIESEWQSKLKEWEIK